MSAVGNKSYLVLIKNNLVTVCKIIYGWKQLYLVSNNVSGPGCSKGG